MVCSVIAIDGPAGVGKTTIAKKLSKKKREVLFSEILENCASVAVGVKWNDYIDKYNIKIPTQRYSSQKILF